MDNTQQTPNRVSFNNGLPPVGTSPVDQTQTEAKRVAPAKAKGLAETCQKYVFALPFTKESLGVDKLEIKHKVFNTFFVGASILTFPVMLPMAAARLNYVAYMEAKIVKKGQKAVDQLEASCGRMGIEIKPELRAKIDILKSFDNSKHITDKPFIKATNEVIKEMNELHVAKRNEMHSELKNLGMLCRDKEFMKDTDDDVEFTGALASLSQETKDIVGGKKEYISMREEHAAIKELKEKMGEIPELKKEMLELESPAVVTRTEKPITDKEIPILNEKPIPPLVTNPLTEKEVASFKSSGNPMKDFIQCGAGFSVQTEGDVSRKVVDSKTNANSTANTLAFSYKNIDNQEVSESKLSSVEKSLDRALEDLEKAMKGACTSGSDSDNSALGSLAQKDRILDIAIGAFESNLYNPSLKADLDKGAASKIKNIIRLAQDNPQLKAKADKLGALANSLQSQVAAPEIKIASDADVKVLEKNLNKIREGDFKGKDKYAQSMAADSRDIYISLTQGLDQRLLANEMISKEYQNYSESLVNSITTDILKGKDGEQVANSVAFYAKVAKIASDSGDHATALTILQALSGSSIERLTKGEKPFARLADDKKNGQLKETLATLSNLYDPTANFKNLRTAKYDVVQVPVLSLVMKDIIITKEGNKDTDLGNGEKLPNADKGSLINKALTPLIAVGGLTHGEANNCTGFTSVIDQFKGQDMKQVVDANYARSKTLLSPEKAKERREKAEAKAEARQLKKERRKTL